MPQGTEGHQDRSITAALLLTAFPSLSRKHAMKTLIYSMAVAILPCSAAISFTPAQATTAPDLKACVGSSLTPVHCRRVYHCHWTTRDTVRTKHCHICG